MLVLDCPYADGVQAVVDRIRNGTKARDIAAEAERQQRLEDMLKNLDQFFGRAQPPTPLYREGSAVRELLALTKQQVLIYRDGDHNSSTDYFLTEENLVSVLVMMGNREGSERVLSLSDLAQQLCEKRVTFDMVLKNVRAAVDHIMACVNEEGVFIPTSNDLPKQTYPVNGCIVTFDGKKFIFSVLYGFGIVTNSGGWRQLISFNCSSDAVSRECMGYNIPKTDRELIEMEKTRLYLNLPVHIGTPL